MLFAPQPEPVRQTLTSNTALAHYPLADALDSGGVLRYNDAHTERATGWRRT